MVIRESIKKLLVGVIIFYQRYLSPIKSRSCRFYPTCSDYAIQAINKYGILKGLVKAGIRILKCNPFHPGGYDPV